MRNFTLLVRGFTLLVTAFCAGVSGQSTDAKDQTDSQATLPKPEPLKTTVSVNASLNSEVPASITTLNRSRLLQIPGITLDDRLRQVAGFSLFRRSSSLVANPTTQGVSLRATGSTGASRTLVRWDGLPINDPFGSWVYWDRIDPNYIAEVDIDRGASTSVFGNLAMGGTISLFSPQQEKQHLFADFLAGSKGTADAGAGYSDRWGDWGVSGHSRALTTTGFYIIPDDIRGAVDTKANVRFATGDVDLDYLGPKDHLALHFNLLAEARDNGTRLTKNSTGLGTVGANYNHSWFRDQVSLLGSITEEQFHSTFSSVSTDRNSERLTSKQTVPVNDWNGAAYWQHHETRWSTIAGADADRIHGYSYDYSYSTHILTPGGGTLVRRGLFGQGDLTFGPAKFFAGVREQFTGQLGQTFFSPNGGVTVGLRQFRLRASAYKGFRAPTLNELYRNFRVGNALTLANSSLVPEGLLGVETGVDWHAGNTLISATLFRNELDNLIDNATLSTSPTLILRKRQNFPSALSRGFEANARHQWGRWSLDASYLFADARFASGLRIAQLPRNQGTAQIVFSPRKTFISAGVRSVSLAFDDSANQFPLPGFATVGLSAQRYIISRFSAVASVDNLLDRTYLVALTPAPNTGTPLIWRAGLRWNGALK